KTGAFVIPMLNRLERGRARARMPRSLILEPTRELAAQVVDTFDTLGANHKLTVALLIGGVSFDEQDRKLDRGADVVIATPGRLLDHFERGKLLLTGIEILVIDEADRMLDMGFIPDIERISKLIPPRRQTLFFSATMPAEIQRLANKFLVSPERIEVAPPSTTAASIKQFLKFAPSDPREKRAALRELIRSQEDTIKNAIIFCNRKRDVAIIHRSLVKHGFDAAALHGDMDQHQRMATLEAFRAGEVKLLAASDVAARGLDIPEVSHIFNFDVPVNAEDYVHRIGRTGRAGREGFAATLVTPQDMKAVRAIEALVRKEIPWIGEPPPADAGERKGGRARPSSAKRKGSGAKSEASSGSGKPRRGRGRGSRSGEAPSRKESEAKKPAAAGGSAPKRKKSKQASSPGMGDHVPAFLTKPIRSSAD
ncbi:MAG: DEAD/DEAH box helicase, partial [Alphaproteobacteria bacterium]